MGGLTPHQRGGWPEQVRGISACIGLFHAIAPCRCFGGIPVS